MTNTFTLIEPYSIDGTDYWVFNEHNNFIILDDLDIEDVPFWINNNGTTTIAPPRRIYPAETYNSNEPIEQRIWWNKTLPTENKWVSWFYVRRGAMLFFKGNAFRNNDFEGWLHEHPRNTDDCKVQAVIGDHRTNQITASNFLNNYSSIFEGAVAVIQDEPSDTLNHIRHDYQNIASAQNFEEAMPIQREGQLVESDQFAVPKADKVKPRKKDQADTADHRAIRERAVKQGFDDYAYHGGRGVIDAIQRIKTDAIVIANPTADDPRHIPFTLTNLNRDLGHGLPVALEQRSGTRELRGRVKTDFAMILDAVREVLMERRVLVPNLEGDLLPYDCVILADDREAIMRDVCEKYHALLASASGASDDGLLGAFGWLDFDTGDYAWNGGL